MEMESKRKNSNKPEKKTLWLIVILAVFLLVGVAAMRLGGKDDRLGQALEITGTQTNATVSETIGNQEETVSAIEEVSEEFITVETAVCPLQFPAMYSELLHHMEVIQDDTIMEVFSMVQGETELELFRIYFSSEKTENDIGFIKTERGNKYITLSVCERSDEEFADAETREQYYSMMGSVDVVLSSIQNNSSFSKKGRVEINIVDINLDYWSISVPDNMEWEEVSQDGSYFVTFYGNVNGEKIKLYAISVGEPELKSVLGNYTIDGIAKSVSVESYDLPVTDGWTEEAITELYTMMSTINDVIQVIMSSENFSAELPEG